MKISRNVQNYLLATLIALVAIAFGIGACCILIMYPIETLLAVIAVGIIVALCELIRVLKSVIDVSRGD